MKVYLNEITGMADGLVTMYLSKRTWTPELDAQTRADWETFFYRFDPLDYDGAAERTRKRINSFLKYAWAHTTMLDFVTVSATVQGMHRAGQDDWDAHACRFNNRIIRSSTRLADFHEGEMSDYYKGKIIPTDMALSILGLQVPETIEQDGQTFVRAVNGYIREDCCESRDVKRGLYMQSIPSNFIFKVNLAQWAHVYRLRNKDGTANPEVKQLAEMLQDKIESVMPWFDREFFAKVMI